MVGVAAIGICPAVMPLRPLLAVLQSAPVPDKIPVDETWTHCVDPVMFVVRLPVKLPVVLPIPVKPDKLAAVAPNATLVDPIVTDEFARSAFGKPEINELAIKPLEFVSTTVDTPVVPTLSPAILPDELINSWPLVDVPTPPPVPAPQSLPVPDNIPVDEAWTHCVEPVMFVDSVPVKPPLVKLPEPGVVSPIGPGI